MCSTKKGKGTAAKYSTIMHYSAVVLMYSSLIFNLMTDGMTHDTLTTPILSCLSAGNKEYQFIVYRIVSEIKYEIIFSSLFDH